MSKFQEYLETVKKSSMFDDDRPIEIEGLPQKKENPRDLSRNGMTDVEIRTTKLWKSIVDKYYMKELKEKRRAGNKYAPHDYIDKAISDVKSGKYDKQLKAEVEDKRASRDALIEKNKKENPLTKEQEQEGLRNLQRQLGKLLPPRGYNGKTK